VEKRNQQIDSLEAANDAAKEDLAKMEAMVQAKSDEIAHLKKQGTAKPML